MSLDPKYSVSVRKGLGKERDWRAFNKIIFEVSIDNPRYSSDRLVSILYWAKQRFANIAIIVCDVLNKYNICYTKGVKMEEAVAISKKQGSDWLSMVPSIFSALNISPTVTYWDDWLTYNNSSYKQEYSNIIDLYNNNLYIKKEIDSYFDYYYLRKGGQLANQSTFKQAVFYHIFLRQQQSVQFFASFEWPKCLSWDTTKSLGNFYARK